MDPTLIRGAAERIAGRVHTTPVARSTFFDRRCGAELFFKCENFQKTGSFKARGAFNAVLSLDEASAARGVVTASSGNHGQALAYAAAQRGIRSWIVMPRNAPEIKRAAVAGYGGTVVTCESTLTAREQAVRAVAEREGATLIHSHDAPEIIAGQGTAAVELIEAAGPLDMIVTPVGGGGLLSGTALAAAELLAAASVWGAEPLGADDAARSLAAGQWLPSESPMTIADGLLTSLGRRYGWPIIRERVTGIVTVDEAAIAAAMTDVWRRMKLVIEPSSAVAVAALDKLDTTGRRIGIILSGGNVDVGFRLASSC